MTRFSQSHALLGSLLLAQLLLAGCASVPAPTISREGDVRSAPMAGAGDTLAPATETVIVDGEPRTLVVADPAVEGPQPQLRAEAQQELKQQQQQDKNP